MHWLQIIVLVNPLIYVNEGMRAGLTHASHMHLYVVYPVTDRLLRRIPRARPAQVPGAGAVVSAVGPPGSARRQDFEAVLSRRGCELLVVGHQRVQLASLGQTDGGGEMDSVECAHGGRRDGLCTR